jgi:arylsulfatase A-like enzyme
VTAPESKKKTHPNRLRRNFVLCLIVLSSVAISLSIYFTSTTPHFTPIPMKPLAISADATSIAALAASPAALRHRNVVLVTLDTTRPDRLGCYGNANTNTPTLDQLARDGVIFSNAIATAPTTLPAHASIFTGLYPHHHGARTNGLYRLGAEQHTIAEMLSENGYDTAAFVSAFVLDKRFGLDQGFDHYDDKMGSSITVGGYTERRGHHTTEQAIQWLETERTRPYFLWVHYYDPHQPHSPPSPFFEQSPHPYDGEIAFMDYELGLLLDKVWATSDAEPLIVVVADHGEALGEHGERTHASLAYDATLRIPLILHAPEALGRGLHMSSRVSQVDLLPTIATLVGIAAPKRLDGVDLTRVQDFDRPLIAEAVDGQANFGWAGLAVLYRGALKYIDGPNPELFDLARDPLEEHNIIAERKREADELERQLRALRGENARLVVPTTTDLDAIDVARLEALGYVVTAGLEFEPGTNGPDPKHELPLLLDIYDLIGKVHTGPPESTWQNFLAEVRGERITAGEAIVALEAMAAAHPDFAPVYRYLGFLYQEENRPEQAARVKNILEAKVRGRGATPGRSG